MPLFSDTNNVKVGLHNLCDAEKLSDGACGLGRLDGVSTRCWRLKLCHDQLATLRFGSPKHRLQFVMSNSVKQELT